MEINIQNTSKYQFIPKFGENKFNFSYIYNNEIPCSLNASEDIIQGKYILKENIYPEIDVLIHIFPDNESIEYNIFCDMFNLKKDKIR